MNIKIYADRYIPLNNPCIFRSSFTITNDTAKSITDALYLSSVVVASTSPAGVLSLYDSIGSTSAIYKIADIDLSTLGDYNYNIFLSSGLTYSTMNNSKGITILYRKGQ